MKTSHYRMMKYANLVFLSVQYNVITLYKLHTANNNFNGPLSHSWSHDHYYKCYLIVLQRDKGVASEMSSVGGRQTIYSVYSRKESRYKNNIMRKLKLPTDAILC